MTIYDYDVALAFAIISTAITLFEIFYFTSYSLQGWDIIYAGVGIPISFIGTMICWLGFTDAYLEERKRAREVKA